MLNNSMRTALTTCARTYANRTRTARGSSDTFEHLDHREKNGYLRFFTPMTFAEGDHAEGLVYVAGPENAAFLGPAPMDEMAAHIARSHGPSGPNAEYLLHLARALEDLGAEDEHVSGLARRVEAIMALSD